MSLYFKGKIQILTQDNLKDLFIVGESETMYRYRQRFVGRKLNLSSPTEMQKNLYDKLLFLLRANITGSKT